MTIITAMLLFKKPSREYNKDPILNSRIGMSFFQILYILPPFTNTLKYSISVKEIKLLLLVLKF